jgi:hypothetical protein
MNERIQELADQAIEDMPGAWNIPDEFCKKFAELIVRECALWIELQDEAEHPTAWLLSEELKEHFGVRE